MKNFLNRFSLKWKFLLAMLTVVISAMVILSAGLIITRKQAAKQRMVNNITMFANAIADNCASSIIFHDNQSATQTLQALKADNHIIAAAIYNETDKLFAVYNVDSSVFNFDPVISRKEGYEFKNDKFRLAQPIAYEGAVQGTVLIIKDTLELNEWLAGYLRSLSFILVLTVLGTFFIASALQKVITGPLTRLADTAQQISHTRNFSLRARKETNDETGVFVDGFNVMLSEMEDSIKKLQESEERFSIATQSSGGGIWDFKIHSGVAYLSPQIQELLGVPQTVQANTDHCLSSLMHPDDTDRIRQALQQHLASECRYEVEYRIKIKNGQYNWFHEIGHAVRDENGKPVRMVASLADISKRVSAEENIRRFFELSTDLIVMANMEGYFINTNPAFSNTTGYSTAELQSVPFLDMVHPDDIASTTQVFSKILDGQRAVNFENRYLTKDGRTIWLSWNSVFIGDNLVFGVARNITEKRNAEERLTRYADQLRRSNRELEDFATVASHDLQEPLRKVQAFSDRLVSRCGEQLDEQAKDYIDRILNSVSRMRTLVNDLLNFSRVETRGQPFTNVDLDKITHEVISDLEILIASTNAEIIVEDMPAVEADPTQMRQLLQNLIGNAVKFRKSDMPPKVIIRANTVENAEKKALYYPQSHQLYQITVEDNGIGFDQAYSEKIFTIFQRLHGRGEYEGTGVGLAICRKIVERHHGRIAANSSPGEGAKFTFILPEKQIQTEDIIL